MDPVSFGSVASAVSGLSPQGISTRIPTVDRAALENQLKQLNAQLAALPTNKGFGNGLAGQALRGVIQGKINAIQAKLNGPNSGIPPAPDAAPVFDARIGQPRVGFDALKITLPTQG